MIWISYFHIYRCLRSIDLFLLLSSLYFDRIQEEVGSQRTPGRRNSTWNGLAWYQRFTTSPVGRRFSVFKPHCPDNSWVCVSGRWSSGDIRLQFLRFCSIIFSLMSFGGETHQAYSYSRKIYKESTLLLMLGRSVRSQSRIRVLKCFRARIALYFTIEVKYWEEFVDPRKSP